MIHVFGNNHAAIFTGAPPCGNVVPKSKEVPRGRGYTDPHPTLPFRTWFLGPVLAYTFFDKHFEMIKKHIANNITWFPKGSKIVLVCGEVDCRLHIPKHAKFKDKLSKKSMVQKIVDRYIKAGIELKNMGFEPIFFGTHPTTAPEYWFDPNSPVNSQHPSMEPNWFEKGISEDRNSFCVIWNNCLEETCKKNDIKFASIYHHIVNEKDEPQLEYFLDPIHLSHEKCINFIVDEFKKLGIL